MAGLIEGGEKNKTEKISVYDSDDWGSCIFC